VSAEGRQAALEEHLMRPEPTVLLTPSMTEGLDLVDDLARWQVICKLPYPYLGDPQVAARRVLATRAGTPGAPASRWCRPTAAWCAVATTTR
jgi:Rad3-related DNA helicase